MANQLIGKRLKALREARNLSQDELAGLLGFKDRQTVSAIENGMRRVKAEELVIAVHNLGASLDYFTDPFLLVGEGRFSWRQIGVGMEKLEEYERRAGNWLAAFRVLAPQVGDEMIFLRRTLGLTRQSRYEDAMQAGERFAVQFDLGEAPAIRLSDVMQQELGILVLMVDACDGVSGASCRLPDLDVVLIARGEVAGRRHFDLAHELFHLLTWDAIPPQYAEESRETGGNRVEQLANNFAAALLMPESRVAQVEDWQHLNDQELIASLNALADDLAVTSSALRWRLVALGQLKSERARAIPEAALRNNGHDMPHGDSPDLFSKRFMKVMGRAVDKGHLSVRRLANLLDMTIEDIADLFARHGVSHPINL